jgi:UDP-2,4-diacetamido-2,4,6-trideoxy-beta-L-altropyranose hydrolase
MPPLVEGQAVFRADGGTRIGSGHVMRCLALAQAWVQVGGRATFASAEPCAALEKRICNNSMGRIVMSAEPGSPQDAERTILLARQLQSDWIVLDGYHFGAAYQRAIRDSGKRLLVIDDTAHLDRYCAHLLLNQNIFARREMYHNGESTTDYLLGTRFALLRDEFRRWSGKEGETRDKARRVLVTMGGSDPDDATSKVLHAIYAYGLKYLEVMVVVGADNPHKEKIENLIRRRSAPDVRLVQNVAHMPELMDWADVAVTAGGSTCWELAYMGVPAVVLVLADNQKDIAAGLDEAGVMINLGSHEKASDEAMADALITLLRNRDLRRQMGLRGRKLVDGNGCDRVVSALQAGSRFELGRDF